jgi:hypothetical protein
MMAGVLYLSQGQTDVVLGLNLFPVRFLEVAGFARVLGRRELPFSRMNRIDYIFLFFYTYMTVVFLLRSSEARVYQIGLMVDATLCYFIFRSLIIDIEDFRWFLRHFVFLLALYAAVVAVERFAGQNLFILVGASASDMIRGDRIRCIGSFRHPILLGTLGASFFPLYLGLFFDKASRIRSIVGIGLCLAIVVFSNSGGPLNAAAMGLVGWLLWFKRREMKLVRRSIVGLLVFFAIFMKAPIWYLPDKLAVITGGDGWHRSHLLEMAAHDIGKWWLAGMSGLETKDWFAYTLHGGADITDQYIAFGLAAGLGALALFILLLVQSFKSLGTSLALVRSGQEEDRKREFMLWGLGVMLAAHVVNWLGVCYFDQMYVVWFMQLATISSLSQLSSLNG